MPTRAEAHSRTHVLTLPQLADRKQPLDIFRSQHSPFDSIETTKCPHTTCIE